MKTLWNIHVKCPWNYGKTLKNVALSKENIEFFFEKIIRMILNILSLTKIWTKLEYFLRIINFKVISKMIKVLSG